MPVPWPVRVAITYAAMQRWYRARQRGTNQGTEWENGASDIEAGTDIHAAEVSNISRVTSQSPSTQQQMPHDDTLVRAKAALKFLKWTFGLSLGALCGILSTQPGEHIESTNILLRLWKALLMVIFAGSGLMMAFEWFGARVQYFLVVIDMTQHIIQALVAVSAFLLCIMLLK